MKFIISFLLFAFSITYKPNNAVAYARKYCWNYNPDYPNYPEYLQHDNAHFVSQCLLEGGQNFDGCPNVNRVGLFSSVNSLKNCLRQKGWKSSKTKPPSFKAGYPMIKLDLSSTIIVTEVKGNTTYYCSHLPDICDRKLDSKHYYYFYL